MIDQIVRAGIVDLTKIDLNTGKKQDGYFLGEIIATIGYVHEIIDGRADDIYCCGYSEILS